MDEIGVDKVMIPASKFKSYKDQEMQWNFTIEEIFDIVKKYPDRLYGLYEGILILSKVLCKKRLL